MAGWKTIDVEAQIPALRRYARALTRDAAAADDLVQDALVSGLEHAASFDKRRQIKAWLLSILHNRFIDDRRRADAEQRRDDLYAEIAAPAPARPEQSAYLRQISTRFDALPEAQRAVLHLIAVEGLSYAEAAAALDVPIGTIMSRLARARAALRREDAPETLSVLRIVGGTDAE